MFPLEETACPGRSYSDRNAARDYKCNIVGRRGTRFALDDEVRPVTSETGAASFALNEAGVRIGDVRLVWDTGPYDHATLHDFLRHWIYRDQEPLDLLRPGVWSGLAVCVVGLPIGIAKDAARTRQRKEGRRLKGPELLTADQFNLIRVL